MGIIADQIRRDIIKEIKKTKCYCITSDEVTDFSNVEQISFVLVMWIQITT